MLCFVVFSLPQTRLAILRSERLSVLIVLRVAVWVQCGGVEVWEVPCVRRCTEGVRWNYPRETSVMSPRRIRLCSANNRRNALISVRGVPIPTGKLSQPSPFIYHHVRFRFVYSFRTHIPILLSVSCSDYLVAPTSCFTATETFLVSIGSPELVC